MAVTYMLRTCNADMTSYGGFVYPESGPYSVPDWDPKPICGGGSHGLLMGDGAEDYLDWSAEAKWLIVEVEAASVVDINRKVKVPAGVVVFCGDRFGATAHIISLGADPARVVGGTATAGFRGTATAGERGTATAGDGGTATAGYRGTATVGDLGTATAGDLGTATAGDGGTATAGYGGTATAGDLGTATAGYGGTATAGDGGTATAGYGGTATAGYRGTATAGYGGTATAGYRGTATAGDLGTATAGYRGTATAGFRGTATAGERGTATAGDRGILNLRWWDGQAMRDRIVVAYVGEDGIKAGVAYCAKDGKAVEATP